MSEPGTTVATGEPAALPIDARGEAVLKGQFAPAPDDELPVIVGDGSVQLIRAADLPAARDQGWELATTQQVQAFRDAQRYESASAQARTAGEAAARGLTLGLSDAALVELGVDPEGLLKRKELNPMIAGAGEIAGAVAPLVMTGGGSGVLGAAAKGVRTLGAIPRGVAALGRGVEAGAQAVLGQGILARGASLGAAGAVEGGLYGLGQAVSEAAIQDAPLTAERIAAHMGTGALIGGVAGGTLGSVAASVEQKLIPKIKEILASPGLERAIETAGLKQWAQGRGKAMFTKLRRDFGDDAPITIGRAVREEGLDDVIAKGATWDEMHAITQAKHRASGVRIGEALKQIDAALPGEAAPAVQRIADRARKEVAGSLRTTGIRSDRALADRVLADFPGLFGDDAARAAAPRRTNVGGQTSDGGLMPRAQEYDALGTPITPSAADDAARTASRADSASTGGTGLDIDPLTLQPQRAREMNFESLHKLRARIDDIAFPKGLADPTPYQKSLQKLRGIIEEEITTAADAAAEKMATAGMAGNYSSEKLRYRALGWLNKAAESNAASEMANRSISLSDYVSGSAVTAGSLASLLAGDMGALGAMAISGFMGTGASLVNKFLREEGQGIANRLGMKVLSLRDTAAKQEAEVAGAIKQFFQRSGETVRAGTLAKSADAGPLLERFELARDKLEKYEQAPEQKLAKVLGDTPDAAPAVANEVRAVGTRAATFLRSKLPAERISEYDAQPLLKRKGARVSDSEMAKYLRYVQAVERPRTVIDALARGHVSREGIEALKAVYPRMYADLVGRLELNLAQSTKRLSRSQLVQLSIACGRPLDPTMAPEFIAACQSVHQARRAAMEQAAQGGGPKMQGSGSQAASSMQTESQRLEAGG